ncbi:hypothetical protein ACFY12_25295 [Streptomyces sp. NPDC001339]|uniref:hypothetical protein n=1 Tax=Streptomyces sp. NPDC001339 TaxID=3364563 RepID=UPI0036C4482C
MKLHRALTMAAAVAMAGPVTLLSAAPSFPAAATAGKSFALFADEASDQYHPQLLEFTT